MFCHVVLISSSFLPSSITHCSAKLIGLYMYVGCVLSELLHLINSVTLSAVKFSILAFVNRFSFVVYYPSKKLLRYIAEHLLSKDV